ncbi:hypothetical protein [Acetobacter conturbans]|uniref:Uncharacterized protein n=1 Tax=Acetobacter conturbans TaxID=1737472 RepID=A0ABX0JYK0_9PROT|nr:hypothetical protein [Acetobacter conturbans]NHN88469.1 hypothetical protein [Acetobacter conturbans]
MTNLSEHDEALLQEKTGLTREAIRTIEMLGFTLTRTASLLSYMKDLAEAAETQAVSERIPSGEGAASRTTPDAVSNAAKHQ